MIEGNIVRLRSIELSDVDDLLKDWNSLELRNLVGAAALGPMSQGEEEEWVRSTWKDKGKRQGSLLPLREFRKKIVGHVKLVQLQLG